MTNPDLIILGKDPDFFDERDTYSRWLLQCPGCDRARSVTYKAMRWAKRAGRSRCHVCAATRGSHLKVIQDIPDQLIIIEQIAGHAKSGDALSLVECPGCGKQRLVSRSNIQKLQRTFCSHCCYLGKHPAHFRPIENVPGQVIIIEQAAEKHSRSGRLLALVECPGCGRQRLAKRYNVRARQTTYCRRCLTPRGENHPLWKGGHSRGLYPHDWYEITDRIRKRDFHTCQYPGCRESRGRRRLPVHHILPLSESGDNSEYNLITLCSKHHGWADRHLDESIPILSAVIDTIY